jgi:hypothetical protein
MNHFDIDNAFLEPTARSDAQSEPQPTALLRMAYSQAISLKRIAEALERHFTPINMLAETPDPLERIAESLDAIAALLAAPAALRGTGLQPAADGWLAWNGGECPVPAGTLVDVRHRDGDEFLGVSAGDPDEVVAEDWSISDKQSHPGDIVAYRIHKDDSQ